MSNVIISSLYKFSVVSESSAGPNVILSTSVCSKEVYDVSRVSSSTSWFPLVAAAVSGHNRNDFVKKYPVYRPPCRESLCNGDSWWVTMLVTWRVASCSNLSFSVKASLMELLHHPVRNAQRDKISSPLVEGWMPRLKRAVTVLDFCSLLPPSELTHGNVLYLSWAYDTQLLTSLPCCGGSNREVEACSMWPQMGSRQQMNCGFM